MFIRIELISLFIGPNGVLNLMVSGLTPDTYSSNPQLGSGGNRAMQLGLKLSW